MTPRIAAYETLFRLEKEQSYSNIAVSYTIEKYHFEKLDRDFYTQLVYGVIEKKLTLDYFVKQYTEKSPSRLDFSVLTIFRLSLYQLFFLDRIPQSAAVSEGMKLASRFASRAKNYVNAILRKACRVAPVYPTEEEYGKSFMLSVKHSISKEIVALLMKQYPKTVEEILQGYETVPHISLQINALQMTPETFLNTYNLPAERVEPLPFALKLTQAYSVTNMPFLQEGQAFVQDIASQLTTLILNPEPQDQIIDVCACPGGKSFSCANFMVDKAQKNNLPLTGSILSCDLHDSKLPLVKNGAERLGYTFIDTICHDASKSLSEWHNSADKVICDVPCSGLGVINKKPEIRYKDIQDIHGITEIQYAILKTASSYLKPSGILLYSTCTINQEENENIIERFLKEHPDFKTVDFEIYGSTLSYQSSNGMLTLFPSTLHDGFFMAKLQKIR